MSWPGRLGEVPTAVPDGLSVDVGSLLERLSGLSRRGLALMYQPHHKAFPQTVRGVTPDEPPVAEGRSIRYTAIAALGLSRLDEASRREVLGGDDVVDLLPGILAGALAGDDPGAIALSVWTAAETAHLAPALDASRHEFAQARQQLLTNVRSALPLPTVDHAWSLVALLAAGAAVAARGATDEHLAEAAALAAERLLDAQAPTGLFPHHLPAHELSALRSHVACFADQVYPVQALARYAAATGDERALQAATRCADRIVALQGDQGQWWWHYDWRRGTVVEGYPVYSVHQHAMAPMALRELHEAGGPDHGAAVAAGLTWLVDRPESASELVVDEWGVVWRKVGRAEPRKAVRRLRSVATAARPELRLGWLDTAFPPGPVDRECRPYELGWLLYTWHAPAPLARVERPSPGVVPHDRASVIDLSRARQERTAMPSPTCRMFGVTLDALTMDEVVDRCQESLRRRERLSIGVLNAAKVIALGRDQNLRESLLACDLLLADGASVVWASRLAGDRPLPERVAGIDLFARLLRLAQRERYGVYLLGATPEVLRLLQARLAEQFPGLIVAGARDGYFTEAQASEVAEDIRRSGAHMLFLGMTSPKKEIFLRDFGPSLGVSLLHGVGGSFDIYAGVTRRAPRAWQRLGMEWAYRLLQEPRRLWRRYWETNTAFVVQTLRERSHPTPLYPVPAQGVAAGDLVIDLRDPADPTSYRVPAERSRAGTAAPPPDGTLRHASGGVTS